MQIQIKKHHSVASLGYEPQIFRTLFIALLLLVVGYLFFVGHITFSVIARKSAENQIRTTTSTLSQLELEYIALDSSIDINVAHNEGYKDAPSVVFASLPGSSSTVGFSQR